MHTVIAVLGLMLCRTSRDPDIGNINAFCFSLECIGEPSIAFGNSKEARVQSFRRIVFLFDHVGCKEFILNESSSLSPWRQQNTAQPTIVGTLLLSVLSLHDTFYINHIQLSIHLLTGRLVGKKKRRQNSRLGAHLP